MLEANMDIVIFDSIPLRYIKPDFVNALKISKQANMYAYDAYFLECALNSRSPLLTLDRRMKGIAQKIGIQFLE